MEDHECPEIRDLVVAPRKLNRDIDDPVSKHGVEYDLACSGYDEQHQPDMWADQESNDNAQIEDKIGNIQKAPLQRSACPVEARQVSHVCDVNCRSIDVG